MMMMAMMMAMTITANAMSYNKAKNEALFLSDKMAYELNLSAAQYELIYEINLDYMMSVNGRDDVLGIWWNRRNADLKYVLTAWQYDKYTMKSYFYRPMSWNNSGWTFNIYTHYSNKNNFYNKTRPNAYGSYKGGNNHKNDRYYADKKVDKSYGATNGKRGDAKTNHQSSQHSGQKDALLAHNNSNNKGNQGNQGNHTSRRGAR